MDLLAALHVSSAVLIGFISRRGGMPDPAGAGAVVDVSGGCFVSLALRVTSWNGAMSQATFIDTLGPTGAETHWCGWCRCFLHTAALH